MKIFYSPARRIIFAVVLLLLVNTSGCINRKEIDKLGLLGAIGVDHKDHTSILTMEITKPKPIIGGGAKTEKPYVIVQTSGNSFFDALRNTTNKFDRKIFLATSKVFIISGDAAKEGIADILDCWSRDHDARETDYLLITKDCEAADIIGVVGGVDDTSSLYLSDLIKANNASSKSIVKRTFEFLKDYYSDGIRPTLGVVQLEKKAKPVSENSKEILLEGAAVFKEDKLAGYLDGLEARALNFAKGKVKSCIIVTPSTEENKMDSIEVNHVKSELDVALPDKSPSLKVTITIDGMLGEDQSSEDFSNSQVMKQLEDSSAKVVKDEVDKVIKKAQKEYGLDIFGFGQIVHNKYPEKWKKIKDNWDDAFSRSEYQVEVKVNISRSGLLRLPNKTKIGK
ncbi:MAG: Spore germination protein B3 [Candidatus Dichloromethanomonas elyunquensis]|nr:MAG: Spore germination protein B3 [Candidatus Dichloromethanomonas elyunquensis]